MTSIAPEDLVEFHIKHIGPVPKSKAAPSRDTVREASVEYYSDGNVRTLTDEEVAFFRASELRQLELLKKQPDQHKSHTSYKNQSLIAQPTSSIEETQPFTPISSNATTYSTLYGEFKPYIQQLESKNDERFIEICRKAKLRNYYPILPINN